MAYKCIEDRRRRERERRRERARLAPPGPGSGFYDPAVHRKRGRKPGDGRGNLNPWQGGRDTPGWPTKTQFKDYEAALRKEWHRRQPSVQQQKAA